MRAAARTVTPNPPTAPTSDAVADADRDVAA